MQKAWVWAPGQEDPVEKEMATHSSIIASEIPWTEEPGRLQSVELQIVRHNFMIKQQTNNKDFRSQNQNMWGILYLYNTLPLKKRKHFHAQFIFYDIIIIDSQEKWFALDIYCIIID